MFARYFFICVGIISLLWIGYVAVDIIDKKNAYSPTTLFGKEEGELLIINRVKEVNRDIIPFKTTIKNNKLLAAILPNLQDERSIFISAKRSHFLIESKFHWSKEKIKTLFSESGLIPVGKNLKSFTLNDYSVEYHKNYLYFHLEEFSVTTDNGWGKFDKKASASIIRFSNDQVSSTDIYFKGENTVEYHSKNDSNIKGFQVNDKDLFSVVLPESIDNYHFFEKNYLSTLDDVYSKGPMYKWLDKGFVSINYKGHRVLICDYTVGQDPINILFEEVKKDADNEDHAQFSSVQLTQDFPKNNRSGFYIYNLNDYVVISENQAICEEIVKDNKLGNTLATNNELLSDLFKGLPKLVSERVINSQEKFSRTVYKSKVLETRLPTNNLQPLKVEKDKTASISMNMEETISDFITFEGKGNCLALTSSGVLMNFKQGKLSWKKVLSGKIIGKIQYIKEEESILITNSTAIHLFDRNGNYTLGGPIELQGKTPIDVATHYQWKGKNYIVYPSENGELITFDSKRKQHSLIKSNMSGIIAPIDVWISQKKLFYGVRDINTFKMYETDRKREFRSFPLPGASNSLIKGTEIKLFASDASNFVVIDQKGNKNNLNHPINTEFYKISHSLNEIYFVSKKGSFVSVFNSEGKVLGEFNVSFSDIENIDVKSINGRNFVSIIDGLENNVYLYQLNGKKITDRSFEGSKKTTINSDNNTLILTTIVDNYLIQYMINF